MKKTAEEILLKQFDKKFINDTSENGGAWMKDGIIDAMEEYARQSLPSISEEEIKLLKFIQRHLRIQKRNDTEQGFDKGFNQKTLEHERGEVIEAASRLEKMLLSHLSQPEPVGKTDKLPDEIVDFETIDKIVKQIISMPDDKLRDIGLMRLPENPDEVKQGYPEEKTIIQKLAENVNPYDLHSVKKGHEAFKKLRGK